MAKYLDYGGLEHLVSRLDNKIAAAGQGEYLPLAGGTMAGDIILGSSGARITAEGHILTDDLFNGGTSILSDLKTNVEWPSGGSYLYSAVGKRFETERYGTVFFCSFVYWYSGTGIYTIKMEGPDGAGSQTLFVDKQGSYFAVNNVWIVAGSTVTIQAGYVM